MKKVFGSIYAKALIVTNVVVITLVAVYTGIHMTEGTALREQSLIKRGSLLVAQGAAGGTIGVFSGNLGMILSASEDLLRQENVTEITYYDTDGNAIGGKSHGAGPEELLPEEFRGSGPMWKTKGEGAARSFLFIAPVYVESYTRDSALFESEPGGSTRELQGWVKLVMTATQIEEEKRSFIARSLLIALLLTLLASFSVYHLLRRHVGDPLGEVKKLLGAVSDLKGGKYPGRIDVRFPDEIGTLADEFNQMAQALREREDSLLRLAKAVESAGDGIAISDMQGRVVYANPAFEGVTGYGQDEVIGSPLKWYLSSDTASADCLPEGEACTMEQWNKKKDGREFLADIAVSPIRNESGERLYTLLIMRDITEKDRMEKSLMQMQKMEAIGTLAGGIAHDFNNILGGVLGYTSMMKARLNGTDKESEECFNIIEGLSRRGASITRQILGFARQGKCQVECFCVNALVEEMSRFLGETIGKGIVIDRVIARDECPIEADSTQIYQALLNICLNARDAMPEGGLITITTDKVLVNGTGEYHGILGVASGHYVEVTVSDTGVGMDASTMDRIFEPFFTTKEPGMGTGLGLSMAYGIVKNHGGHIAVESESGKGSVFRMIFPAAPAANQPAFNA